MGDKLGSQSWVFDLFIVSRIPSIEKFKAHILAKIHSFLEWNNEKILRDVNTTLWRVRLFYNRRQNIPDSEIISYE